MTNQPPVAAPQWVCSDCGANGEREGDCAACGKGPLLDVQKDGVRDWLLDEDTRRRENHRNRILWITVVLLVVADCGGGTIAPAKVATTLWSIPGLFMLIVMAFGLSALLLKIFPAKSRFDALKR